MPRRGRCRREVARMNVMGQLHAYQLDVPAAELDGLAERLTLTRLPDRAPRPGWNDGIDTDVLYGLLRIWRDRFDWREHQARLNTLPHFRCDVDGLGLHFLHHRGARQEPAEAPVPIMLVHGWPGTFVQMTRLSTLLAEPRAGTGRDVVVPSLPGFGFSDRPTEPGWNLDRMARTLHHLMTSRLGYRRYAVRGSDFGLSIALRMGYLFPEQVAAVHVGGTHLRVDTAPEDLQPEEQTFIRASRRWYEIESAYNDLHATKPQTIGVALNDSPAGLLAWICEKYQTWSVPGALFNVFTPEDILTTATIYWLTQTATSSARLYREELLDPTPLHPVQVPLYVSQPAVEEYRTPESWWRRTQPVTRYSVLPEAAHFPEWEAPLALAEEITTMLEPGTPTSATSQQT